MDKPLKEHLQEKSTWKRGFFMLVFLFAYGIAEFVLCVIILFQFLAALITGKPNNHLLPISRSLSRYVYDMLLYLTYNSENQVFPFADFPKGDDPEA